MKLCEARHPIYVLPCVMLAVEPHTIHGAFRRDAGRYVYWSNGDPSVRMGGEPLPEQPRLS